MKSTLSRTTGKSLLQELLFEIPIEPKERIGASKKAVNTDEHAELKKDHIHKQYRSTVENRERHIKELAQLTMEKLGNRLDIIREQMQSAFHQKKYDVYELLSEWEMQTTITRLIKFDKEL